MSINLLKTGAIAAAALLISVTGAFAAPHFGTINYNTPVKANHSNWSPTVNFAHDNEDVMILDYSPAFGGWFKIKVPGPDGWVPKSAVHLDWNGNGNNWGNGPQVCFNGPFGQMCVSP